MTDRMRRRELLSLIGLAAATKGISAVTSPLQNLGDWLGADAASRKRGLESCLERIRQLDPSIHAWVQIKPQPSIASGPLSGIPFGVKDIIEAHNLVTEYGSPIYKGRQSTGDAAIVQKFRSLGAIVMGKTHTAAFAYQTPAPTRNPRNLEHTPGGSSSGSAAAVAAGMVPFALGTQTLGSVLRPASYCGVTGFKPSYGWFSKDGVLPFARSLDTLGLFTNTPADMLDLWESLGNARGRDEDFAVGAPELLPDVEPEMAKAFQSVISLLRGRGISVQIVRIAAMLDKLRQEARLVMFYEGARFHKQRFEQYGVKLQDLAGLVREGLQISDQRYQEALNVIAQSKQQILSAFKTTPVILTPAATGPAPLGLASTGDSRRNSPWTALGTPAISIPMPVSGGLPLGLQLAAERGQEERVLNTAKRLAAILSSPA
jgi:Asp-tRNA(Asn)/Glu-tRNA(Gln) amidotransferase A subunit family amidase